MFVNTLTLLVLGALTYWVIYVLPKKVNRTAVVAGCLVATVVGSELRKWLIHTGSITSWGTAFLNLLPLVAMVGFMAQASQFMVEYQVQWHRDNNAQNLQRLPLSFLEQHHETTKKLATGFWFFGALYIFSGVLLWAD
jgi:hypothetical protein